MSCNSCKNPKKSEESNNVTKNANKVFGLLINIILYLTLLTVISITIIPIMAIVLFNLIILGKSDIDIVPIFTKIFGKKQNNDDDIEDDEDEDGENEERKSQVFENVEI